MPVEQLPAVQLAEHLEQAGDFPAHDGLGPAAIGAVQERAQVPMARVLERQAVEDPCVGSRQRKLVEGLDRARVAVQHRLLYAAGDLGVTSSGRYPTVR